MDFLYEFLGVECWVLRVVGGWCSGVSVVGVGDVDCSFLAWEYCACVDEVPVVIVFLVSFVCEEVVVLVALVA